DVVAQVRIFGLNDLADGRLVSVEVQRSLSQPTLPNATNLHLYIPNNLWARLPQDFRDDPMTLDRKQHSVYILFLSKGDTIADWGQTYTLMGGPEGAFMVMGD